MEISLIDRNIRHIPSFNGYTKPKNITWCRDGKPRNITVYTDRHIYMHPPKDNIQIAWLMEPRAINEKGYNDAWMRRKKYDYIMSHDLDFLKKFPEEKRVFCPGSGSSLYEYEWKLYPKTKSTLTVVGNKNTTEGHKLRHLVVEKFGDQIDVLGRGHTSFPPEKRAETYAPYRFQVVIHNSAVRDYWTDILLDCFLTGTIPIVWKGDFLRDYFNMDGISSFETLDQLEVIINDINQYGETIYENSEMAVEDNFVRAKQLAVVEDYLYDTFFKNLLG